MRCKTEGIVLRTLRFQEDSLIATLLTEHYGVRAFILKGYRSARSQRKFSQFQPLSIVQIEFILREGRDLQKLNESHSAALLHTLQQHPVKLSLALTLIEVAYQTVREETPNPELYAFLKSVLLRLDQQERQLIQVFIWAMAQFTRHLGFFPADQSRDAPQVRFDPAEGIFYAVPQAAEPVSGLLLRFLNSSLDECQQITFNADEKRGLIQTLFVYYQIHVSGFQYPQTLKVFAEVFS